MGNHGVLDIIFFANFLEVEIATCSIGRKNRAIRMVIGNDTIQEMPTAS